jgi:hypothetical protein
MDTIDCWDGTMDIKLTILFLMIGAIVGLADGGGKEALRPAFRQIRARLSARVRRAP